MNDNAARSFGIERPYHSRRAAASVPLTRWRSVRVLLLLWMALASAGTASFSSALTSRLGAVETPVEVLRIAAEAQQKGELSGKDVRRVFKALAKISERFSHRDTAGTVVPGLNKTMLLYHKPFAQQRATLVRAAVNAAPSLTGKQAALLLHHSSVLAFAGFAGAPLCSALAIRLLDTCQDLSPKSTARALQACGGRCAPLPHQYPLRSFLHDQRPFSVSTRAVPFPLV
jgi:hypothetical protein